MESSMPDNEKTATIEPVTSITQIPTPEITIKGLQVQANEMLKYAESRKIVNGQDAQNATFDLSIISKAKRTLEDKRKEYVQPLNDQVKSINETFKLVSDPLNEANQITKNKILAYQQEQDRKRREQEEINRMRIEAAEKEAALKDGEITESVKLVEVIPEVSKKIQTDMGTAGQRANWKYEIVDFAQLPDAYKMVDNSQLTAIARRHHDQKKIPGVRFYNEPFIAVRTR